MVKYIVLDDVHITITFITQNIRNYLMMILLGTAGIGKKWCRGVEKYSQPERLVAGEATATQIDYIGR